MSDRSALVRTVSPAMANQYMQELLRHTTDENSQGILQARSTSMPASLSEESLDAAAVMSLQLARERAIAQGNTSHLRQLDRLRDWSPAKVRALGTLLGAVKEFEGPLSADGKWPMDPNDARYNVATSRCAPADDCFERGQYHLAAKNYMEVMRYLLGLEHPLPGDGNWNEYGIESQTYRSLSVHRRMFLIKCCHQIAICKLKHERKDTTSALAWLNEADIMAKNRQYADPPSHAWVEPTSLTLVDMTFAECLISKAKLLDSIGNSSAYQHTSTLMGRSLLNLPPWNSWREKSESRATWAMSTSFNNRYKNQADGPPLSQRHPDPESDQRYQIIDPNLQVRGAWKKENLAKEEGLLPKTYCESLFIWGGYLYSERAKIAPGVGARPGIPELRRISLKDRIEWEHVTTFPTVRGEGFLNRVCIDGNKMYAFSGHPQMDILNLSTNKWTTVKTTWKPTANDRRLGIDPIWPWPKSTICDSVAEIINGKLYIFGGLNGTTITGCNLFMQLDLKTLKWRRLSGTPGVTEPDLHQPGPRGGCGSWVSPDKKRLYIFSGVCQRARKGLFGEAGPPKAWTYDDFWSWDIATETWTEERMQGNPPSPRHGMGCTFSKKLNASIIFGGANSFVQTSVGNSKPKLHYGSYADTFMWSPSSAPPKLGSASSPGHWKQIQTVGFPTYRMFCHLLIDPDTEDIYLYGGEVGGDSIPSKTRTEEQRRKRQTHESAFSAQMSDSSLLVEVARELGIEELGNTSYTVKFGDLWKLHVDVPGGGFEVINMEDELRTATLGPWQRCFECRGVGFWKKCGGSCSGKAFFCSTDCQTKGWKAHKKLNGCRKII